MAKDINAPGKDGYTELQRAVCRGQVAKVAYLISVCGADPNITVPEKITKDDRTFYTMVRNSTALSMVSEIQEPEEDKDIKAIQTAKLLLEHKADLQALTNTGQTALHAAVAAGRIELSRLFIDYEPDLLLTPDSHGQFPLVLSILKDNAPMCHLLTSRGTPNLTNIEESNNIKASALAVDKGHANCAGAILRGCSEYLLSEEYSARNGVYFQGLIMIIQNLAVVEHKAGGIENQSSGKEWQGVFRGEPATIIIAYSKDDVPITSLPPATSVVSRESSAALQDKYNSTAIAASK